MTLRGLALALGAALAAALAVRAIGDAHAARGTFLVLAPVGAVTVLAAARVAARGRGTSSLSGQFSAIGAVALGQLLLVLALFTESMYVSSTDVLLTGAAALYCGLIAWWSGRLLARRLSGDVESIRAGLRAVGEGARPHRVPVAGHDELARLAGEVEEMAARLNATERARRGLIASVSHDLRTPITSLALIAEAVDDDIIDPAQRRAYLSRLTTHVRALSVLIDDLFELSRLESGDIGWSMERVALDELVSETVDAMAPAAEARHVAVRAELPAMLAPASANPEQIQRVLFNLIQNAIRHTPADGSVTVRAEPGRDAIEVEVSDTGEGIAPGERERVFEAFFRGGVNGGGGPPASGDGEVGEPGEHGAGDDGAGLGLAIARAIVEAHGGRIWLPESALGTRVRFSLPAAR